MTDPTGEFPCPLGRNPDGGCRGGDEVHVAGQFAKGAGAAGRDFFLGLAAPAPVRGQHIIDGAKATLADCYAGLTTTINPVGNCLLQASGLTDLIQGLTLAFHGCVYIGAYIATGGAIQLALTLAPFGAGRATAVAGDLTAAAAEDAATGGLTPGSRVAVNAGSRLAEASSSAFRAADNIGEWTVSVKHLPGAGGSWSKWAEGVDINGTVAKALRSEGANFLPNAAAATDRFIVRANMGSVVGTRGDLRQGGRLERWPRDHCLSG